MDFGIIQNILNVTNSKAYRTVLFCFLQAWIINSMRDTEPTKIAFLSLRVRLQSTIWEWLHALTPYAVALQEYIVLFNSCKNTTTTHMAWRWPWLEGKLLCEYLCFRTMQTKGYVVSAALSPAVCQLMGPKKGALTKK